tara:strand:+ start:499 stop:1128 length:630 start_codon:yes stop_codon:yes gene_type:complete
MKNNSFKNIDSAWKLSRMISIVVVVFSFLFSASVYFYSMNMIKSEREKVYVLDNGASLKLALKSNMKENRPAEIRNHVTTFQRLFFTLDPDPKQIKENISSAMFLIDNSGLKYEEIRQDKRYYEDIVAGNISTDIQVDSIKVDVSVYPYVCYWYGKERRIRPSKVVINNLFTRCQLRDVSRTDNNPHGLIMERYTVLNNKTIESHDRKN